MQTGIKDGRPRDGKAGRTSSRRFLSRLDRSSCRVSDHRNVTAIACREIETRGQEQAGRCKRKVRGDPNRTRWQVGRVEPCLARIKHNVPFPQTDEAAFPLIAAKTVGGCFRKIVYINARAESAYLFLIERQSF